MFEENPFLRKLSGGNGHIVSFDVHKHVFIDCYQSHDNPCFFMSFSSKDFKIGCLLKNLSILKSISYIITIYYLELLTFTLFKLHSGECISPRMH